LIFPLTGNYIFAEQIESEADVRYSFSHVGIQQEIYSLIPKAEKESIHWRIGQDLLKRIPEEQREGRIFELVNQLNLGAGQIQTNEQRLFLAELNLLAAQRSFVSAAHEASYQYGQTGHSLLSLLEEQGIPIWQDLPAGISAVFAATAAYLIKRYDEMENLYNVLRHAASYMIRQVSMK
jgi:predicted ATPase